MNSQPAGRDLAGPTSLAVATGRDLGEESLRGRLREGKGAGLKIGA